MEAVAPPVNPVQALKSNLQMTLLEAIKEQDIQEIAGSLAAKAKTGDLKAIQMLFDLVMPKETPTVNVKQIKPDERQTHVILIAECIGESGPLKPREIAAEVGLPQTVVSEVLNHEWFEKDEDGIHLSQIGWNAIRSEKEVS